MQFKFRYKNLQTLNSPRICPLMFHYTCREISSEFCLIKQNLDSNNPFTIDSTPKVIPFQAECIRKV